MKKYSFIIFLSVLFSACSSAPRFTSERNNPETKTSNRYDKSSSENSNSDYAKLIPLQIFTGTASYYADEFNGKETSNGETYNMDAMTAAQPELPFNSIVRVTNLGNNKSVILRINDRGPLKNGRIIDVSLEAAKKLGMIKKGTADVRIEVLKLGEK